MAVKLASLKKKKAQKKKKSTAHYWYMRKAKSAPGQHPSHSALIIVPQLAWHSLAQSS